MITYLALYFVGVMTGIAAILLWALCACGKKDDELTAREFPHCPTCENGGEIPAGVTCPRCKRTREPKA